MRRRTFDVLVSAGGLMLAAVLIAAGGLLMWGYSYANNTVHDQLAAQQIFFPSADNAQLQNPEIGPFIKQYAGQQLLTGEQAQAYADHYINVHLNEQFKGQTYSQLSAKSLANPNDTALAAQVQTAFRGQTLRGLLLNAYGWWKMGQIAKVAAWVAFAVGAVMLVLSGLGIWHTRRTPVDKDLAIGLHAKSAESAKDTELVSA